MHKIFLMILVSSIALFVGCGKKSTPLAPERLSPNAVLFQEVKATKQGVSVTIIAPKTDIRGKTLKELTGYRIYRKEIENSSDISDRSIPFELIETIDDNSIELLAKKKEEARAQGKSVRAVSLNDKERMINFFDKDVSIGKKYLYKIAPFNYGSFDGKVEKLLSVVFKGEESQISYVENDEVTDPIDETNIVSDEDTDVRYR